MYVCVVCGGQAVVAILKELGIAESLSVLIEGTLTILSLLSPCLPCCKASVS